VKHARSLPDRRHVLAALLAVGLLALLLPARARAAGPAPAAARLVVAQQAAPAPAAEGAGEKEGAGGGWMATVAKALNFAALLAILIYYLKSPTATYLRTRLATIRRELDEAAALRATAEAQLGDIRAKLAGLPTELDALRQRGRDDLASERARLTDATAREKERLLDRTRREIDLQSRLAHRALLEQAADLAMRLTRAQIEREITAADQARLIERYAAEVRP
jgi:F-type H+-transporting ATPase subunit b